MTTAPDTIVLIHGFWVTPAELGGLGRPLRGRPATPSSPPPTPASRSRSRRSTPTRRRSRRSPCRRSSSTWRRSSAALDVAADPDRPLGRRRLHADPARPRLRRRRRGDQLGPDRGRPGRPAVADPSHLPGAQEPRQPAPRRRLHARAVALRVHEHVQRGGVAAAVRALPHPRVRLDLLGQRAGQHPPGQGRQLGELRERRPRAAPVHLRQRGPPDAAEGPAVQREALQVGDGHRGRGVRRPAPAARPRRAGRRSPTARSSGRSPTRASGSRERRPGHARRRADRPHRGGRLAAAHRPDVRPAGPDLPVRLGHGVAQADRPGGRAGRAGCASTPSCSPTTTTRTTSTTPAARSSPRRASS